MAHTWILGQSGTGKSTTLIHKILDADGGVFFLDPHGYDVERLIQHLPKHRRRDVVLFDMSDSEFPIGFNILENIPEENRPFVASSVLDAFKTAWGYSNSTTPLLDQYLYNTTAALLDAGETLLGMKFMLTSESYRQRVIKSIKDPIVKSFWAVDFAALSAKEKRQTTMSTVNKIEMLLADPRIRNVIGQKRSGFKLKEIIDEGRVLLVVLPQGKLGLWKTRTLGAFIVAHLHAMALSRTSSTPFHVFIDECHHFGSASLIEMLSGIRKFHVDITLAHQYLTQLSPEFRDAIIGNVTNKIAFTTGIQDSEYLRLEFGVDNLEVSLAELERGTARTSGVGGRRGLTVKMPTLPDPPFPNAMNRIRRRNRNQCANRREDVEAKLNRFITSVQ